MSGLSKTLRKSFRRLPKPVQAKIDPDVLDPPTMERLVRRASDMHPSQLISWAEGCLWAVGRSLSVYRSSNDEDERDLALANARQEARVLQALLTEL